MEKDEFIRIPEMAAELKISRGRAYALVADGTIPAVQIGRSLRVSRRELRAWLEAHRIRPRRATVSPVLEPGSGPHFLSLRGASAPGGAESSARSGREPFRDAA